jgi:hypothetical protein
MNPQLIMSMPSRLQRTTCRPNIQIQANRMNKTRTNL